MNQLLVTYLTAMFQVSLLAGVALLLNGMLAKRRADVCAVALSTASLLIITLTAATLLPLPRSWTIRPREIEAGGQWANESTRPRSPLNAEHGSTPTLPRWTISAGLDSWFSQLARLDVRTAQATGPQWPAYVVVAVMATICLLLARLALAVRSAQRLLRTGQRHVDSRLTTRVERLRSQLGCSREVAILISPEIPSAATVGWRRPAVLLSSAWPQWSDTELNAVLAHELTHIRRGDYLLGIIARVAVAIHFYNPLVRWLAGQLALTQEIVADTVAAQTVGGRQRYIVALSKLALRQDRQFSSLPVLAFSFTSSTFLTRRIKMLQTKDGHRHAPRALQRATITALVLSAVVISAIRQPVHSQEADSDGALADVTRAGVHGAAVKTEPDARPTSRPPFVLSYLPDRFNGIFAFRPNVLFARPDMRTLTTAIDAALKLKIAEAGYAGDLDFSVADLEQAVGPINLEVLDPDGARGERGRMTIGLAALRAARPVPVPDVLEATVSGTTRTTTPAGTIIESPQPAFPALGPQRQFAMPDDRTVLPGISAEALEKMSWRDTERKIAALPWYELWKTVEPCMIAVVYDNDPEYWETIALPDDAPEAVTVMTRTESMAWGCDLRQEELQIVVILECREAADAESVADHLRVLLDKRGEAAAGKADPHDIFWVALAALRAAQVEIKGSRVMLSASTKLADASLAANRLASELTRFLAIKTASRPNREAERRE